MIHQSKLHLYLFLNLPISNVPNIADFFSDRLFQEQKSILKSMLSLVEG
jgi:hypothetical protein